MVWEGWEGTEAEEARVLASARAVAVGLRGGRGYSADGEEAAGGERELERVCETNREGAVVVEGRKAGLECAWGEGKLTTPASPAKSRGARGGLLASNLLLTSPPELHRGVRGLRRVK